jgi:peptidoglycan/LPS O-acetylase OafA/YrhL
LILSPLEQLQMAKAGAASSLYVSNFWFLRQAFDYFAPESAQNPFLHTWSLSVEEQFYILWHPRPPGLVIAHFNARLRCPVLVAYSNETTLGVLLLTNSGVGVWDWCIGVAPVTQWVRNSSRGFLGDGPNHDYSLSKAMRQDIAHGDGRLP